MATKETEKNPARKVPARKQPAVKKKTATTMKGRFTPKRPEKYIGKVDQIFFRSSWELRFMVWADNSNTVLKWGSEEIAIPYIHPLKRDLQGNQKIARYFPDFLMRTIDAKGQVKTVIVEIKPLKESVLTEKSSDRDKEAWVVNQAKWAAARAFAARNNAEFAVVTEEQLFWKGPAKQPKPKPKAISRRK